jgi:hypothetical protein
MSYAGNASRAALNDWVAELKSQNANNAPRRRTNENFLITTISPSPSGGRLPHLFFMESGRNHHGGRWFDAGLQ